MAAGQVMHGPKSTTVTFDITNKLQVLQQLKANAAHHITTRKILLSQLCFML